MALAAHAINNREKLDNMFAEQKKTRRDAAKKYGKMNAIIILTDSCKIIRLLIKLHVCNYKNKKKKRSRQSSSFILFSNESKKQ